MGKINSIDLLSKGFVDEKLAPTTPTTIAINSARVRSMDAATRSVNGTSQAGTVVMYDEHGDDKPSVFLFTKDVTATLRTAVNALTTTNKKTIPLTKKAADGTDYISGANVSMEFPLDLFVYAYPHPTVSGDSLLYMLAEDRKSIKIYQVDETPAAIIALANA